MIRTNNANLLFSILTLVLISCNSHRETNSESVEIESTEISLLNRKKILKQNRIQILQNIRIGTYFEFMDSVVNKYDSLVSYSLSEHLLVRNNPWIIDTLANTDYYRMMMRDSFVHDQRQMIVLPKGSYLNIPDSLNACKILEQFSNTEIDINIPEYKLRIFQDSILLYTFPVRVGQHRQRYLKFGDRVTDLRTKTGNGSIVQHVKHPDFYNPVNGKRFYVTRRDDGKTTMMPQIPWIETEINNVRNGQMIHPTTNPKTLGKAYSNGCIGLGEADAWIVYYHAPIGTQLKIRYDLETYDEGMVISVLRDIYNVSN